MSGIKNTSLEFDEEVKDRIKKIEQQAKIPKLTGIFEAQYNLLNEALFTKRYPKVLDNAKVICLYHKTEL